MTSNISFAMDEAFLARNALNASLGFSGDMRTTALITNGEVDLDF